MQPAGSRLACLLLLFATSIAGAEELPRVAAQPLVLLGAPDASRAELRTTFLSAVARQPVAMVSSFAVDSFLAKRGGEGCALDEACLMDLCKETQADFSISVTVQLNAETWTLRGRTLSCSGLVSREVPEGRLVVADGPQAGTQVADQLDLLVRHLVIGEALPVIEPPKVAVAPPPGVPLVEVKQTPPPALTPTAALVASPSQGLTQMVRPGWVGPTTAGLWVVAAGTAGAAGTLAFLNLQDSQRIKRSTVNGLIPPTEVATAVAIDERTTAAVGLAAGAATAAASALVIQWVFGGEEKRR